MQPNKGTSNRTKRVAGSMVADEPLWLRLLLIGSAYIIMIAFILVPLSYVFIQALGLSTWIEKTCIDCGILFGLRAQPEGWHGIAHNWTQLAPTIVKGWNAYWNNLVRDPDTRHAIWLTMTVAPLAVLLNTVFGLAAAWSITRFRFPGRTLLITLLDIPFAVSPIVAGLMFVLLFGMQGYFGPMLRDHGIKIIFAWPGLLLVTTFVTLPFVARELIPLMEALGSEEEVAAVSLGANPWQLFWRVTLPNIKWGLLFGMIQCFARAIGEFGAVYVVSGHIAGQTDTMPLRVEKLFQEYNNPGSYAVASLLTLMALTTLFFKLILERWIESQTAMTAETQTEGMHG